MNRVYLLLCLALYLPNSAGCDGTSPDDINVNTVPERAPDADSSRLKHDSFGYVVSQGDRQIGINLPELWVSNYETGKNNIYAEESDIHLLEFVKGGLKAEYSEICNHLFSQADPVFHAGLVSWVEEPSLNELQMRIYLMEPSLDDAINLIWHNIDDSLSKVVQQPLKVREYNRVGWHQIIVSYEHKGGDYYCDANVDIRFAGNESGTIAVAFMYSDIYSSIDDIRYILSHITPFPSVKY